jgi:hypothetical protein
MFMSQFISKAGCAIGISLSLLVAPPVFAGTSDVVISANDSSVAMAAQRFSKNLAASWVRPVSPPAGVIRAPLYFRFIDTQYRFGGDSGKDRYSHFRVDGENTVQLRQSCKQTLVFNPVYETLALHAVKLWRGGEAVDQLEKTTPRFIAAENLQNVSIYSGLVTVVFEIPDCRTGDGVELAWTVSGNNPVFGKHSFTYENISDSLLNMQRSISFLAPVELGLQVGSLEALGQTRWDDRIEREDTQDNGWQRISVTDVKVPPYKLERDSVPGTVQLDAVTASTFKNWTEVQDWASDLFVPSSKPSSSAYQALLSEVKQRTSPAEQVAAALRWVQREVRYVSISLGQSAYRPASPDTVLERRFGDCKDVALLLTTVLRDAGVEVQPALMLTTNSHLPAKFKAVPWFDHAVAVAWVDGRPFVLDATAPYQPSPLEKMGVWHGLAQVMVVTGLHQGFVTIPLSADPQDRSLMRNESMRVDPEGNGVLTVDMTLHGLAAERERAASRAGSVWQSRERALAEMRYLYPSASWAQDPTVNDNESDNSITIKQQFNVPDVLARLPGGSYKYTFSNAYVTQRLTQLDSPYRFTPVALRSDIQHVVLTHSLEVPEGWKIMQEPYQEKITTLNFTLASQRYAGAAHSMQEHTELTLLSEKVEGNEVTPYMAAVQRVLGLETVYKVQKPTTP